MRIKDLYQLAHDLFVNGLAGFTHRWASIHARSQYSTLKKSGLSKPIASGIDWHLFTASALVVSAILWLCFLPMFLMIPTSEFDSHVRGANSHTNSSTLFPNKKEQTTWEHKIGFKSTLSPAEKVSKLSPNHPLWSTLNAPPAVINLNHIKEKINVSEVSKTTGIEGIVIAKVLVDRKGNYRNHRIIRSDHVAFSEAVEKHINQLNFTPAIHRGYSSAMFAYVSFDFRK